MPPPDGTPAVVPQARERERETRESLSLLEEQLSVKEKTITIEEADLEKVRAVFYGRHDDPVAWGLVLGTVRM